MRICAVLLLTGGLINIAVAWGFAWFSDRNGCTFDDAWFQNRAGGDVLISKHSTLALCEFRWEPQPRGNDWTGAWINDAPFPGWVPKWSSLRGFDREDANWNVYEFSSGWPWLSMHGLTYESLDGDAPAAESTHTWGAISLLVNSGPAATIVHRGRFDGFKTRVIPLLPIASGFALNTLAYAGALGALILPPLVVRSLLRRRGGRCPACGYPVGTSTVCTECGNELFTPRR